MIKEEFKRTIKDISRSKLLKTVISIFGVLVIAAFIFEAGVFVGFHRASFGHDWQNNYEKNFGFSRHDSHMGGPVFFYEGLPNAHGAVGTIVKAELPTIIVADKDKTEKVVLITKNTEIRTMRKSATTDDLKIDTSVIVIGSPNKDGQIEAKLIRILPVPLDNKEEPFTIPLPSGSSTPDAPKN